MAAQEKTFSIDSKAAYPFIPSTDEHNRLEEQSAALNDTMLNKPVCAPLKSPTKILDLGCGTGYQTHLLAKMYPDALIVGVDKSAVPDLRPKLDNIVYVLGEFDKLIEKKHELLQPGTFDLVYQRMLVMGVTDWTAHLEKVKALLKPGGYIESQEMNTWDLYDREGHPVSERYKCLPVSVRGPLEQGIDLKIPKRLPELYKEAGFEDLEQKQFPIAFRQGWKERPETESLAKYVNWATRPMWRHLLIKGAREGEDAQELFKEFESEILEGEIGIHGNFIVNVGRKG